MALRNPPYTALNRESHVPAAFGHSLTFEVSHHIGNTSMTKDLLIVGARVSAIADELCNLCRAYDHDSAPNRTYQMAHTLHCLKNTIYNVHDAVLLEPNEYTKAFKQDLNRTNIELRLHLDNIAERIQYVWTIDEVSKRYAVRSLLEGDQFTEVFKYMNASSSQLKVMQTILNEVTCTREETPVTRYFGIRPRSLNERSVSLQAALIDHQTTSDEYLKARQQRIEENAIEQSGQVNGSQMISHQQSPILDLGTDLTAIRHRWLRPTAIEDEDLAILPSAPAPDPTCTQSTSSGSFIIEWLTNQNGEYHSHDMAPAWPNDDDNENKHEVQQEDKKTMTRNKESSAKWPFKKVQDKLRESTGGQAIVITIRTLAMHSMLGRRMKTEYTRLV